MATIFEYLEQGLVVNIFYLRSREALKAQLVHYLENGTKSLVRKHIPSRGHSDISVCEYKCYKVLTFFDYLRVSKYYAVSMSMYKFPLFDYLLDYIISGCDFDCVRCNELDFFTHYAKRRLTNRFTQVKLVFDCFNYENYKLTERDNFPYRNPKTRTIDKLNTYIRSMMLLDFDRVYRVVALKKVPSVYGFSYVITLFDYVEHLDYEMFADFWMPRSCLSALRGSKHVNDKGYLSIYDNQWIRVVGTNEYKGSRYVVIKSFVTKTITQLRKGV